MAKQSILKRAVSLFRTNAHSALDALEDPKTALEATVREHAEGTRQLEHSVAEVIGNLRLAEQDQVKDIERYNDFTAKIQRCLQKEESSRAAGDEATAKTASDLARRLAGEQMDLENRIRANASIIEKQKATVEQLKTKLDQAKEQHRVLVRKKDELVSRANTANAVNKMHELVGTLDSTDATSELGRLEAKIRGEEAKVIGHEEMSAGSLDSQLAALEATDRDIEVEARLAAIKGSAPSPLRLVSGSN